jgi:DNA invertase Pin-like site-specific DNA recombinase
VEWVHRPQAALLLQAITSPARTFDAIVVGEFERAFYGDQFLRLAPTFASHGVAVWLPELDGPADPSNQIHLAVLTLLAVHSKREVQRARLRAKAAMRAQIIEQGRHLGGRPPYGYRLGDAGPHPNAAHARWGRRAHRLEPDPHTAPHVQWIFAQRLAGHALASIARDLNDRGIPCPSAADPTRNPHRHGNSWYVTTVAAILANPRYTDGRSGTSSAPTTASPTPLTTSSAEHRRGAGTWSSSGWCPPSWRIHRWSANRTSSRRRPSMRPRCRLTATAPSTCLPD